MMVFAPRRFKRNLLRKHFDYAEKLLSENWARGDNPAQW
jgi:hypothetical protein